MRTFLTWIRNHVLVGRARHRPIAIGISIAGHLVGSIEVPRALARCSQASGRGYVYPLGPFRITKGNLRCHFIPTDDSVVVANVLERSWRDGGIPTQRLSQVGARCKVAQAMTSGP